MQNEATDDHAEQVEARFIEQEHRLVRVLINYFSETKGLPDSAPRRKAAKNALIWQLIPTGGKATFALGGLLALSTLYFTAQQAFILQDQNSLLAKQEQATESKYFWERRAQLLAYLYDMDGAYPKYNQRIRSEAVAEFLQLEGMKAENNYLSLTQKGKPQSSVATLSYGVDLEGAILTAISLKQLPFRSVYMPGADLRSAKLVGCDFAGAHLDHADLSDSDLTQANLAARSLLGVDFTNADLSAAVGWGDENDTPIYLANIHGIKNAPEGFREWALKGGAVDEPSKETWLKLKRERFPMIHQIGKISPENTLSPGAPEK